MRFRNARQEEAAIDLTPFIDVVFMLLLFFVVSTNFYKKATELDVQLPDAKARSMGQDKRVLEVGVDVMGGYILNGRPLGADLNRLKVELSKLTQSETWPLVVVGDRAAPYQSVVSVLEVAGECGLTQVQMIARESA